MRLLIIGHTYTVAENQKKISALASCPDMDILLITPQGWRGPLYNNRTDLYDDRKHPNVKHAIIRAIGIGKEGSYLYGLRLFAAIRDFRPDVAYVEQGAYALCYSQILWALKWFCPNAVSCFFTWWNLPYAPSGLKRMSEQFNLRYSSGAIAGNIAAKQILRNHGFAQPIWVLPQLGVDSTQARAVQRTGIFRIGYIGRVAEEKGVIDLVNAIAMMPSKNYVKLIVVGIGDALEEMKALSVREGIRLTSIGAVKNDQVTEYLRTLDVLVLPSRTSNSWMEQFGHILIEAMAASVPVIGSSSGEIPNVIDGAGLIFSEGDSSDLARCLERVAQEPGLADTLRVSGLARIEQHYSHTRIAEQLVAHFKDLLRNGKTVEQLSKNRFRRYKLAEHTE